MAPRLRRMLAAALLTGWTLSASTLAAQSGEGRCLRDALGNWFCASDPKGVAVLDNLGEVVCAPGRCVELEDELACSTVSGGSARLGPEGAVCDGECRVPRAVDCERGAPSAR